jgi:cytochrome c-type biogenesis protein CcmF
MIPQLLVHLLFGLGIGTFLAYVLALRGDTRYTPVARLGYYSIFGGLMVIAVWQMINIVTHNFDVTYVYGYSSRELAPPFLYATFYAGQEGSFMLWTIMTAAFGLVLLPYVRRRDYEEHVMVFYTLILCFLLLMMVVKNPFALLWESYAKDGTTQQYIDSIRNDLSRFNGKGLNPVLQNRWIMIHPPILFAGFAAMSIPFVLAMAALIKRSYDEWITVALPWALAACGILGFGIMLGGFWAYVTLGWGGFWAWDPVENSSLIPWLICVALVHTMLVQQRTKGLIKTNFTLATLAFVAVLYSTFLTRSGVLGDTSVHAFVEPGFFIYLLLLIILVTFILVGVGLIVWRWKDIAKLNAPFSKKSREFMLSLGSSVLLASAMVVTLGTSYPIVAELLKQPKVAVEPGFYNMTHIPILVVMLLLNAASLSLSWKVSDTPTLQRRLVSAAVVAGLATAAVWMLGVSDPSWLLLIFSAFASLRLNVATAVRLLRSSPSKAGAYVSHFGISLLVLGVIATAGYTQTEHVRLVEGTSVNSMGYTLTFMGKQQVEREYKDREKFEYVIRVDHDGRQSVVKPVLYYSDFNKRQSPFLEPGIYWTWSKDLYVSPKALDSEGAPGEVTVMKADSASCPFDASTVVQLDRFDMSEAQQSEMEGYLKLAVIARFQRPDTAFERKLYCYTNGTGFIPIYVSIPGTTLKVGVKKIVRNNDDPSRSTATFAFSDSTKPQTQTREVFIADVSIKPLINLVWIGVITMVTGFGLSVLRQRTMSKRSRISDAHASV